MRFLRFSIPLALIVIACSAGGTGDDEDDDDDDDDDGQGAGNEGAGAQGGSGPGATVVVEHVFLGVKTFTGVESPDAWETFGFNLDGQVTTNDFSNHCQPYANAPPNSVFPDGPAGIDNSWGKYMIPIMKTAASASGSGSDLDGACDEVIASGEASWAILFDAIAGGDEPVESAGAFFDVRDRMGATWLKAPEAFAGETPLVTFPGGTTQNDAWSSGSGTAVLQLRVPSFGTSIPLRLHRPRIRMTVDASGTYTGVIGGVLDTEEFVSDFRDVVGPLISCDGSALDSVLNQLRQGSDIMVNGAQDPNATCDGISFGIGFTATAQEVGDFTSPLPPPEDPCGTGVGGGG